MNEGIVNFCQDGGSGMSPCTKAGKGFEVQTKCNFAKKSDAANRCRHEVYDEFCDRVAAQKCAKGQPFNSRELNKSEQLHYRWVDNSGTISDSDLQELIKDVKKCVGSSVIFIDEEGHITGDDYKSEQRMPAEERDDYNRRVDRMIESEWKDGHHGSDGYSLTFQKYHNHPQIHKFLSMSVSMIALEVIYMKVMNFYVM